MNIVLIAFLVYQATDRISEKKLDHEYSTIVGNPEFNTLAANLAFGEGNSTVAEGLVSHMIPHTSRHPSLTASSIIHFPLILYTSPFLRFPSLPYLPFYSLPFSTIIFSSCLYYTTIQGIS